jgi:hypothetical protein
VSATVESSTALLSPMASPTTFSVDWSPTAWSAATSAAPSVVPSLGPGAFPSSDPAHVAVSVQALDEHPFAITASPDAAAAPASAVSHVRQDIFI